MTNSELANLFVAQLPRNINDYLFEKNEDFIEEDILTVSTILLSPYSTVPDKFGFRGHS